MSEAHGSLVWSEDLTDAQLRMVVASGVDSAGDGYGVELRGRDWTVARNLVRLGLGTIEGGAPNGSKLPGLYFNNAEGVRIVNEFADESDPDDDWRCEICGCEGGH